ncbi:MAG: UDP-N-acetylmuramoyl-tripeptide--D-alanyl-D-alanine ligase [Pseudoxanthomonas sp.]
MNRTPLSMIAHWAAGELHGDELHGDDVAIASVGNDSRVSQSGGLYVALRGERFDGHEFAEDAVAHGAAALLVDHPLAGVLVPQVVVADTQLALAKIAAGLQQGRAGKVVAITGSNGKTSVKTLLVSILQRVGNAYFNPGNRNNEIGLPLAVIDAPDDADFAVYEMGAGKPGDIAYLADVARPDVALVNNIAPAHLERMGNLLGVAQTKGAIYTALADDGVAVINADDAFAEYFAGLAGAALAGSGRILRFGIDSSADVIARDVRAGSVGSDFRLIAPQGEVRVSLKLPGRHNVLNALAAASLALACGASLQAIAEGLAAAQPVAGRQIAHTLDPGVVLIDDSYNANPGSLNAAIDTLAAGKGEAWLVLGDMRELGAEAGILHADAGRRAKNAGIARLYALGPLSAFAAQAFGEGSRVFANHGELADALRADLAVANSPVTALVKGSRGSAMDRIVAALLAAANDNETGNGRGENTSHAA